MSPQACARLSQDIYSVHERVYVAHSSCIGDQELSRKLLEEAVDICASMTVNVVSRFKDLRGGIQPSLWQCDSNDVPVCLIESFAIT